MEAAMSSQLRLGAAPISFPGCRNCAIDITGKFTRAIRWEYVNLAGAAECAGQKNPAVFN
jgi:hypothetical protein